jgi:hypothetical protein
LEPIATTSDALPGVKGPRLPSCYVVQCAWRLGRPHGSEPLPVEELTPEKRQNWQALRQQLESRRQRRVCRSRFRRNPEAYLARLEKELLQPILPP